MKFTEKSAADLLIYWHQSGLCCGLENLDYSVTQRTFNTLSLLLSNCTEVNDRSGRGGVVVVFVGRDRECPQTVENRREIYRETRIVSLWNSEKCQGVVGGGGGDGGLISCHKNWKLFKIAKNSEISPRSPVWLSFCFTLLQLESVGNNEVDQQDIFRDGERESYCERHALLTD